ncbi:MAG: NAD(P)-dependent oxidoreductase [Alphaproteobacteria bacterium]
MKIAFFDSRKLTENYIRQNSNKNWEMVFFNSAFLSSKQSAKIKDIGIISGEVSSAFNSKTLSKFQNLKAIATRSTGLDHIDLDYCKKKKIKVFSVPHYGKSTIAEFTFTLLLSLIRKLADGKEMLDELRVEQCDLCGSDLADKTIGVIGLGDIGSNVAKIANGFGMKVLGCDPFVSKKSKVKMVELNDLLEQSDIITLHCPATKKTKNMLNKTAFSKMKKNAILINTARGSLINTEALYDAILSKRIAGAGLDVADEERFLFSSPTVSDVKKLSKKELETAFLNQKLLQMEEVIITPHMAFNTKEAKIKILKTTIKNIKEKL